MKLLAGLWAFCLDIAGISSPKLWDEVPSSLSQQVFHENVFGDPQVPIGGSCNTPDNRQCWSDGFDIDTDYEKSWPKGRLVETSIYLTNGIWTGDGYNSSAMLINGTYPGPPIEMDWGDTLRVTVYNNLVNSNGTSIHWHGVRQLHSNYADGVSGIVQCPIPPTASMVYEWTATQYGSSWYHSHFSLQYADGIAGPLVIHGPTSANYDVDLGAMMLTDWYHQDAFSLFFIEKGGGAVFNSPSKLMNGKFGTLTCVPDASQCIPADAETYQVGFERGKKYKWRIVNTSALAHYTFFIDAHNFTVVATDFVPVKPFTVQNITVGIGQRYDIIVEANADPALGSDFWINFYDCSRNPDNDDSPYGGIIHYDPSSNAVPPHNLPFPLNPNGCVDTNVSLLHPIVQRQVPAPKRSDIEALAVAHFETTNTSNIFVWDIANDTLQIDWGQPSLDYVGLGSSEQPFPELYAPIQLQGVDDSWKYFVIQGLANVSTLPPHPGEKTFAVAHPIHLHGHDFVVLAQETKPFDLDTFDVSTLNLDNPPRRDVALLTSGGYLVIAFPTDNPGVWLMHCHIAWHISAGLGLQFVEREEEILQFIPADKQKAYTDQCTAWNKYYATSSAKQDDSGV